MTSLNDFDLSVVLAELFYGDESTVALPVTLDRLLAPDFVQRVNGDEYDRATYTDHVRQVRGMVGSNGRVRVREEVRQRTAIAGRYTFSFTGTNGEAIEFETHVFAQLAPDTRIPQLVEVGRQITPDEHRDLLRPTDVEE